MMMSDFAIVTFNEWIGNKKTPAGFDAGGAKFMGATSSEKTFMVEGIPTGLGYLLIQAYNVNDMPHRISVNGRELSGFDIPKHSGPPEWYAWMDVINEGILKEGPNKIRVRSVAEPGRDLDDFIVGNIAIHYHTPILGENGPRGGLLPGS